RGMESCERVLDGLIFADERDAVAVFEFEFGIGDFIFAVATDQRDQTAIGDSGAEVGDRFADNVFGGDFELLYVAGSADFGHPVPECGAFDPVVDDPRDGARRGDHFDVEFFERIGVLGPIDARDNLFGIEGRGGELGHEEVYVVVAGGRYNGGGVFGTRRPEDVATGPVAAMDRKPVVSGSFDDR